MNVAVLEGDLMKIVNELASPPDCPALLTTLLHFETQNTMSDSLSILVQLAVSMRRHGRGGTLLVVPDGSDDWKQSIVLPIGYAVRPSFAELATLSSAQPYDTTDREWIDSVGASVDAIAGLTAVDGATVMTHAYEVLAFGAKITRRPGGTPIEHLVLTEPIEGATATTIHPGQLGGTRHLSAGQFVMDQHDAVALVASQDGRFTIFAWSPCEDKVYAHRVEALLM